MAKISFKGLTYEIPSKFTNREMVEIEQISKRDIAEVYEMMEKGRVSWGALMAILYVSMRRAGALVTLDEILDANPDAIERPAGEEDEDEAAGGVAAPLPLPSGEDGSAGESEIPASSGAQPSPTSSESSPAT